MALDFVAGCLGGCAGLFVGHPFDTIKVHLQTQNPNKPMYNGTYDCFKKIIKKDSFKGLYRGISSPMSGVAFVNAIVFGVYGNIQKNSIDPDSLSTHFLAGSIAGFVQSFICSPMELAKTRIQIQNNYKGNILHKGPLDCLWYIKKKEGLRGVFRGLTMTALRDIPGFSTYFVAYEMMTRSTSNPTIFQTLIAGGLAGTISWILTLPLDVIKSRLQADGIEGKQNYKGAIDCIRKGYKNEGLKMYTNGITSVILRAFPMNAVCFLVVSWTLKLGEITKISIPQIQNNKTSHPIVVYTPNGLLFYHSGNHDDIQKKISLIKGLAFLGAFSEAVCSSEIIELVNDLYDDQYR